MKAKLVLAVILASGLSFLVQNAFAEGLFYGSSSFERISSVIPDETATFEVKIRYTDGPYAISKLTPIFDVSPESAKSHAQIKTESIDGLYRNDVRRIQGTILVDPQIPYEKIFVSVYFNGTDSYGNPYKSAWTDSITINIGQLESIGVTQKCRESILGAKYGTPIDLEYDIDEGIVVSNCKLEDTNSVITKIDAASDGQITITIPKKVVYSLSSTDCNDDSDLLILMNGEETLHTKSVHSKKDNTITVEFSKGIHTIEFIGVTIIPDPSPDQYCGIVMGFDSPYLPPKFQLERGMKAEQVRCNDGLHLMILKNEKPACVKPYTTDQLVKRGLASPHSCKNSLFVDSGNESLSCFCEEREQFVSGGYYAEKNSSLQLVRKEIVANQFNQVGIEIEFFNPEQHSQYAYVWANCK